MTIEQAKTRLATQLRMNYKTMQRAERAWKAALARAVKTEVARLELARLEQVEYDRKAYRLRKLAKRLHIEVDPCEP